MENIEGFCITSYIKISGGLKIERSKRWSFKILGKIRKFLLGIREKFLDKMIFLKVLFIWALKLSENVLEEYIFKLCKTKWIDENLPAILWEKKVFLDKVEFVKWINV